PASPSTDPHPLSLHDALPISSPQNPNPVQVELWTDGTTPTAAEPTTEPETPDEAETPPEPEPEPTPEPEPETPPPPPPPPPAPEDRKSTRLNSSHVKISYAVF